jgi:hypothetical protein
LTDSDHVDVVAVEEIADGLLRRIVGEVVDPEVNLVRSRGVVDVNRLAAELNAVAEMLQYCLRIVRACVDEPNPAGIARRLNEVVDREVLEEVAKLSGGGAVLETRDK